MNCRWFSSLNKYVRRLSYVLIILILLIIIIVVAIIVVLSLFKQRICGTSNCVILGAESYLNQNRSVHPCDNFYNFACGSFVTFKKQEGYYRKERELGYYYKYAEKLTTEEQKAGLNGLKYLKNFLYACTNSNDTETFKKIAMNLEFPILKSEWKIDQYNYVNTMKSIIEYRLNYKGFFQLFVGYPYGASSKPEFILTAPKEQYVEMHRDYLSDINALANLIESCEDDKDCRKYRQNDLIEWNKLQDELFKTQKRTPHQDTIFYENTTYGEIKQMYKYLIKDEIFKTLFEEINNDTIIFLTAEEYKRQILHNANDILEEAEKHKNENNKPRLKAIINHLVYHALLDADEYRKDDSEHYAKNMARCIRCLRADKRLQFAFRIHFLVKYVKQEQKDKVQKLTEELIQELRIMLRNQMWFDDETKTKALEKLDDLDIYYGVPPIYEDIEALERHPLDEVEYVNKNNSFLLSALEVMKNSWEYEIEQVVDRNVSEFWAVQTAYEICTYVQRKNAILVGNELMYSNILFMDNIPPLFIYAFIGPFISRKLTQGFDKVGRFYDKSGALNNWWSDKTLENFVKRTACMVPFYDNYDKEIDNVKTAKENIADQNGMRLLYNTYLNYINENEGVTIPAFPLYSLKRIFWTLYAQAFCSSHSKNYIKSLIEQKVFAPDNLRVIGTLANSEHFVEDFKCPKGSYMNPVDKCIIYDY